MFDWFHRRWISRSRHEEIVDYLTSHISQLQRERMEQEALLFRGFFAEHRMTPTQDVQQSEKYESKGNVVFPNFPKRRRQ